MPDAGVYPEAPADRDRFVLNSRGERPQHDPYRFQGLLFEDERSADGSVARMGTVLLTGRECPWRCAMCDLWTYTTISDTPSGAIAAQVSAARAATREEVVPISGMKLYNAGSFFDPRAVPESDYDGVAEALTGLRTVIVESHPALVGPRLDSFLGALERHRTPARAAPQLEVAMGLETAHPGALDRLNKRFTLGMFRHAAERLADRGVALRVFLLISPPFIPWSEQDAWLLRSVDAAFECGASVVSLVPTRGGNGAMEHLAAGGSFRAPVIEDIERSFGAALEHARGRGRVFVDIWDLERFTTCHDCASARRDRLHSMNLEQVSLPACTCLACADSSRQ
jgi:archaeosine synthase beta-subunit